MSWIQICVITAFLSGAAWTATPAPAKDEIIPLIEMDNVPVTEAIRQIARNARLNVLLDPRLSAPPYNQMTVSIRWQKVTAREALSALLENYDLVLVETMPPRRQN